MERKTTNVNPLPKHKRIANYCEYPEYLLDSNLLKEIREDDGL